MSASKTTTIEQASVYNVAALAELLDCDARAILRAVRRGELQPTGPGRQYLFTGEEVLRWLNATTRPGRKHE